MIWDLDLSLNAVVEVIVVVAEVVAVTMVAVIVDDGSEIGRASCRERV